MGTVAKRGGRWRAQVRRRGQSLSETFATRREANDWIAIKEAALAQSPLPTAPTGTLAGLLDWYGVTVYSLKRWGASKAYELAQLRADLGAEPLAELDHQRIVRYALELRKRMGGGGIRTRLAYLCEVLRAARDLEGTAVPLDQIEAARAALARQKVLAKEPPRTRRPLDEEIDKIIAYARQSKRMECDLAAILELLRLIPLRIGELCALRWEDLRPDERAIVVRSRKHPDATVKATNDYVVPLPVIEGIDTYPLVADRPRYLPRPFPYQRPAVSSAFWVATSKCGIADLHLHDLRALAISRLLEAGIDIPLVAHLSGHRNWKVLQKHYSRLDPMAIHAAIKKAAA